MAAIRRRPGPDLRRRRPPRRDRDQASDAGFASLATGRQRFVYDAGTNHVTEVDEVIWHVLGEYDPDREEASTRALVPTYGAAAVERAQAPPFDFERVHAFFTGGPVLADLHLYCRMLAQNPRALDRLAETVVE